MRGLLLLALVALTAEAQTAPRTQRTCSRSPQGRSTRGFQCDSLAFFEAFPASGAGTSGACSTVAPTGAKGEALTFTRGSNGTCTKTATGGLATTGIADGDLVVLSSNAARVEYDSAGTLGLLVESSRTNNVLRSQELSNAAWTSITTAGAVTVTADYATAPDGTTTAERLQYAACPTLGTSSIRGQTYAGIATNAAGSLFIKGNGTSGTVGLLLGNASYTGATCSYNSSTWTRCTLTDARASTVELWVGCANIAAATPNPGNTGSGDILVWGGQVEAGTYVTSYIPTVAAAATRSADQNPEFSSVSLAGLASTGSAAIAVTPLATSSSMAGGLLIMNTAGRPMYTNGATNRVYDGTNDITVANNYTANTAKRYWSSWTGSTLTITNATDVATGSGGFDGTMNTTGPLQVGSSTAIGLTGNWIVSRVCVDPDPSRCR